MNDRALDLARMNLAQVQAFVPKSLDQRTMKETNLRQLRQWIDKRLAA